VRGRGRLEPVTTKGAFAPTSVGSFCARLTGVRRWERISWSIGLSSLVLVAGCSNGRERPASAVLAHPVRAAVSRLLAASVLTSRRAAPSATTPRRLRDLAECPNAELRQCLEALVKPQLAAADIVALERERCFRPYSDNLLGQVGNCLPLRVGVDARLGKTLVFTYYCSEVCSGQGSPTLVYENVSADECCKLGAEPFYDPAWGGYLGCGPAAVAAQRGDLHHSTDDGKWRRIVGSRCPGRDRIIYEEWDCEPPPSSRPPLGVVRGRLWLDARPAPNLVRHASPVCPTSFNPLEAETALRAFDSDARGCLSAPGSGRAKLRVTFARTGDVAAVALVDSASLNIDERRCVVSLYKRVHTLPFEGDALDVSHELSLGSD